MKNQSAPCQGVKCPKGYKVNSNCTCTKVQDDSKLVKGAVKEISKEEYNKIRGLKKGGIMKTYKTGGMVNPNAKMQADKTPGSKGVRSGVNPKATAAKTAKKPSAARSKAPKKALPKAKYGMAMKKYGDGGGTSKSSMYGGIGRSTGNMTPAGTSGTTTMTPVEKAKARYGMTVKRNK